MGLLWLVAVLGAPVAHAQAEYQQTPDEFREACEEGDMWYCRELGNRYLIGEAPADDPVAEAEKYLRLACLAADGSACYNLAILYEQGDLVARDVPKALEFYEHACAAGDTESCALAGFRHLKGGAGVDTDPARAATLFTTACSGNSPDPWGCHLLGAQYFDGLGVEQDLDAAVESLAQACRLGYAYSCKVKIKAEKKRARLRDQTRGSDATADPSSADPSVQ